MTENQAREEIAYFMRRLYTQKLTTTSGGNLSIKNEDRIYITPSGLDKALITPEAIGVMTLDGEIIGSRFKPSIESTMHLNIYQARPDVGAIVHAHPATACTFSATDCHINTRLTSEAYAILGEIAYAEYRLMGSHELAQETALAVKSSNCVIMRNHGALTTGKTILEAFDRLEVLENCAIISMNLMMMPQGHIIELNQEELDAIDRMMGRSQSSQSGTSKILQ
ncbi:MAG: class II aldolase/adducin family protein [Victivallales bacterium]|nr:class II aldolase/adducin family protein [Victivallales bacterium]